MELSYSLHLGNDKNKSIKARQEAKNTPSGTTSKNNNAIQNVKQLGKVNHHNLRQYDNNGELIKTIKGSNDIVKDVKELYLDLFEEARLEYNNKQILASCFTIVAKSVLYPCRLKHFNCISVLFL